MEQPQQQTSKVMAGVTHVLPSVGLACLAADDESSWAVTKSTQGSGLLALSPGWRVVLTVTHHSKFSVASAYRALD